MQKQLNFAKLSSKSDVKKISIKGIVTTKGNDSFLII